MAIFGKLQDVSKEDKELLEAKEELDRKSGALDERERIVGEKEKQVEDRLSELEKTREELIAKLEKTSSVTKEEARQLILKAWEDRLREEVAKRIRQAEESIRQEAGQKAKQILVEAMQHGATDYVTEYTVSSVKIPDEEMKG